MSSNPHDLLFKAVYSRLEHARGTLRAIVPAALAEALNWQTLAIRSGNFVDPVMKARFTDLLYAVAWHDGGEALVYLLFEHQSTLPTDGPMVHKLFRYQGRIWDDWRKDHPKAKTLPMIIPIVMYHGTAP